jgi:hypothetical protein
VPAPDLLVPARIAELPSVDIQTRWVHPPGAEAAEEACEGIAALVQLARVGAFDTERYGRPRVRGRLRLDVPACETDWWSGIEPSVFQLVRNMLMRAGGADRMLHELRIAGSPADRALGLDADWVRLPVPDEEDDESAYPPLRSRKPWTTDYLGDTWVRRCLVEFTVAVETVHVEAVAAIVEPWFTLLEAGAYPPGAIGPWDAECSAGDVAYFDEFTVEVSVMRFQASDAAWNSLLNALSMMEPFGELVSSFTLD